VKGIHPLNLGYPTVITTTSGGSLCSSRLFVHVVEGATLVNVVEKAMFHSTRDFAAAAWDAAQELHKQCFSYQMRLDHGGDQRVLLVRGLHAAIEQSARRAGYRQEVLVVVDMVLAAVSLRHGMVVIQAVKKKVEDLEMVVRQIAVACLHYQLLVSEQQP
jgi:hypothetical protein